MSTELEERQAEMKLRWEFKKEKDAIVEELKFSNDVYCTLCKKYKTKRNRVTGEIINCQNCRRISLRIEKYDLSVKEYYNLLYKQDNRCAICMKVFDDTRENRPCVDHCHELGHVRGLLCNSCNFGLGFFQDDYELLLVGSKYLKNNMFKGGWYNNE